MLSQQDRTVINQLFSGSSASISLGRDRLPSVRSAYTYLAQAARDERDELFVKYKRPLFLWIFLFALLPVLCLVLYDSENALFLAACLLFFGCFVLYLGFMTSRLLRGLNGLSLPRRIVGLLLIIPFWFAIFMPFVRLVPQFMSATPVPDGFYGAFLLCLLLPLGYLWLVPKRTALGLEREAQAKGLLMYMKTAEKRRLEALYPPATDVEHFERLFPYALALGVGKTWADTFAGYLARSGQEAQNLRDFNWRDTRSFRSGLGYAASTASSGTSGGSSSSGRSGSGSGGGGASGRGSGGGGGGGW